MGRRTLKPCESSIYYNVKDVQTLLEISSSKAYTIMQDLNAELEKRGICTLRGKISKKYFHERWDYIPSSKMQTNEPKRRAVI